MQVSMIEVSLLKMLLNEDAISEDEYNEAVSLVYKMIAENGKIA